MINYNKLRDAQALAREWSAMNAMDSSIGIFNLGDSVHFGFANLRTDRFKVACGHIDIRYDTLDELIDALKKMVAREWPAVEVSIAAAREQDKELGRKVVRL